MTRLSIEINSINLECDVEYKWEEKGSLNQDHQDQCDLYITKITHTGSDKNEHDFSDILAIEAVHDSITEDLEKQLILEGDE